MNKLKQSSWVVIICVFVNTMLHFDAYGQTKTPKVNFTYSTSAVTKTLYLRSNPAPPACSSGPVAALNMAKLVAKLDWKADYLNAVTNQFTANIIITPYSSFSGTSGAFLPYSTSLVVTKDNPQAYVTFDISYEHPNVNRYDVQVTYVNSGASQPAVQDVIQAEVYYLEEFAYDAVGTSVTALSAAPVDAASPDKEWIFKWTTNANCTPAPNYQFQLLRLFNNNPANTTEASISADIDWSKALTIETGNSLQEISLTLAEGTGYYLWRVRAIGNIYSEGIGNDLNWGPWTGTGTVSGLNKSVTGAITPYLFFYTQFDAEKNWIFTRSFIEGDVVNKGQVTIGEFINYGNGLQMAQQQQKRLKASGKRLVGQTVMDYSGRPALSTLSAPVDKSALGYISNLIKNTAGTPYSAANFDTDINYNNPEAIDTTSPGPGIYYSNLNNSDTDVPTAAGFPYNRVLYTNDGTSTPKEQSGPGRHHKLGYTGLNKHTIRSYQSSVTDGELVTVFGDEAPKAESVSKSISIDPNGLGTVNYISNEGHTIATCLASSGVTTLEALPSASTGAQTINCNLNSINTPYGDNGIRSTKTLVLTQSATLAFTYNITPKAYADACANFCATCDYKITVKITDNENPSVPVLISGSPTYISTVAPTTGTTGCTGTLKNVAIPSVTLTAGSYTIERIVEANQINTAASPPAPAVQNTPFIEQYIKQQELALTTKFQNATTITATVIDGLGATVATKPNVSMAVVNGYLYGPAPTDITTTFQPDMNGLYTYLGVTSQYRQPVFGQPNTIGVKVKLTFDNCSSISIPVVGCEPTTAPTPVAGIYDFEKYFVDWYKANNPFATGVTINTLFNGVPFTFAPGDFNIIVSNMIANPAGGATAYNADELFKTWKAIYTASGSSATSSLSNTVVNNQTSGGLSSGNLTYSNNYLDMFIKSAKYGSSYGYQIRGISSVVGGLGSSNIGYKFHPYAYFQYASTCEVCERAFFKIRANCSTNVPDYSTCLGGQPNFTAYFNAAAATPPTTPVSLPNNYPKNDFYNCIKNITSCAAPTSPPVSTVSANFSLYMADTCKKACDERLPIFISTVKDTYNKAGKYVEGDIYGLSISAINPSIYVFNNTSHVYVPGTDIAKSTIYCQAQGLVDACRSQCVLTVNGTTGEVGTPAQQTTVGNIITGYFDLKLTSGGTCAAGYTPTTNSTQAISIASTINNLNKQLEIERAKAPSNGFYWSYVNFLKGINNSAVVNTCTNQQAYVFIHPEIPSYFEYDAVAVKINYYFNKLSSATGLVRPKRLHSTQPQIAAGGTFTYVSSGLMDAAVAVFTECTMLSGPFIFDPSFTPHLQTLTPPASVNFVEIKTALAEGSLNGVTILPNTQVVRYETYNARCEGQSYWKIPLCATINASSISCPSICYKIMPAAEVKTSDAFFQNQGFFLTSLSCEQSGAQEVLASMGQQLNSMVADQTNRLRTQYKQKCIDQINDIFTASYAVNYYHYTLYYYDRAGNLVKTVPPEGVVKGAANRSVHPAHKMVTEYAYNSLKQLLRKKTPDGGETKFWYDSNSRMRFSQNQQQLADNKMFYTKYDELGRAIEVGLLAQSIPPTILQLNDKNYPAAGIGTDITVTNYSVIDYSAFNNGYQRFLQNRVSNTYTDKDGDINTLNDQVKTFYSYDPTGNVEWILQDIPEIGQRYITYEYDIISGNIVKVRFNDNYSDNFYHRYTFDSDKRIKTVETSKDNIIWDKEANYSYYLHGPLKRTEIGQDNLQGLDYTYTIKGWLKGLNHLEAAYDPGKDGNSGGNPYFAKDVYSINLGYYDGDFISKSSPLNAITTNPNNLTSTFNLYDGNIKTWTSNYDYAAIPGAGSLQDNGNAIGRSFKYDELSRIREAQYASQNATTRAWTKYPLTTDRYYEAYTYDANGNIKTARRNNGSAQVLDNLVYNYSTSAPFNNKLLWVDETAPVTADLTDIEDQSSGNYNYDLTGNLTTDTKEGVNSIQWNLYGKLSKIIKSDGTELSFLYDATGNRVYKKSYKASAPLQTSTTYYVRDAGGNPLAVYERTIPNSTTERYDLKEQPIYGSSRLGQRVLGGSLFRTGSIPDPNSVGYPEQFPWILNETIFKRTLNQKNYEITDHLGNVHAVIADYKVPAPADANTMWNKRFDNNTTEGFAVNTSPTPPAGTTVTNVNNQLRIYGTNGSAAKISLNTTTLPMAGRYSLSFDYNSGNTALASYTIAANPANNALSIIGYLTTSGRQNIIFDVPASGVTTTDLLFRCETATAGREFFIDNILIKKVSSTLVDPIVTLTDNFNTQTSNWTATGATLSYPLVTTGDYKLRAVNPTTTGSSATLSKKVSFVPGLVYKVTFKLDVTTIGTGAPKLMFEYYDNDNANSDYRAFIRNTTGASPAAPGYTYYITPRTPDGIINIKWENTANSTFNFGVDDFIVTQMENKSLPLYTTVVNNMTDYNVFGSPTTGRNSTPNYRYGFNGQEKLDEISGSGNHNTAEFGELDTRLGRRWNQDPKPNPSISNYAVFGNNPVVNIDIALDTPSHTPQKGPYENASVEELKDGDYFSDVQDQNYSATFENISQEQFTKFKEQMQLDPGKIVNNCLAEYDLIDRDGSYGVSVNDNFDIDIWGPDNGGVIVDQVIMSANSLSVTVKTLEGHTDAGQNVFSVTYDPKLKLMTWSTHNVSRSNDFASQGFVSGCIFSRCPQQQQWENVILKVHKYMGYPTVKSAQSVIKEYDYNDWSNKMGKLEYQVTTDLMPIFK